MCKKNQRLNRLWFFDGGKIFLKNLSTEWGFERPSVPPARPPGSPQFWMRSFLALQVANIFLAFSLHFFVHDDILFKVSMRLSC